MMETRTAAPSSIQGRSLHAMKIPPDSSMRSTTGRLPTMRMEFVASNPARFALPACNLCSCALKPERHQICASRHAGRVELAQLVNIYIAQLTAHFLIAKKRRIPDDAARFRPFGFYSFAFVIVRKNGVAVLNVIELAQDRLCGPSDAVLIEPLQITNPDHYGRQLLRVDVRLQAEEQRGMNLSFQKRGKAMFGGEHAGFVPQIEHSAQSEIEKISAPASGIKNANIRQLVYPCEYLDLQFIAQLGVRAALLSFRLPSPALSLPPSLSASCHAEGQ